MRKSNDQPVKDIIAEIFDKLRISQRLDEIKLRNAWDKCMGFVITSRTQVISFRDGVLIVKTGSAPLSEELHYAKEKIVQMLNKEIGDEIVKEIRVT